MTDFGKKTGDMFKSDYDTDESGVVDNAETLEGSSKAEVQDHTPKSHAHAQIDVTDLVASLAGKSATGHEHVEADITDLDHDALKISGVTVDDTDIGDQKVLTYDLGSETIKYITPAPSGAVIKSIQHIAWDLATVGSEQDYAITEIDFANTCIIPGGYTSEAADSKGSTHTLRLKDATTVSAYLPSGGGRTVMKFAVVEYESGIKNIQRGITELLSGDQHESVAITAVVLAKTWVNFLGVRATDSTPRNQLATVGLNSTVALYVQNPKHLAGDEYVSWEVVEFE